MDVGAEGAAAARTLRAAIATGEAVDIFLRAYVGSQFSKYRRLRAVIDYILPDIGVRLRPFLLRASYEAGGRRFEEVLPVAAAIELLQLSTLVVDDFLDESPTRNRKPSVAQQWGVKNALCVAMVMSSAGLALLSETLGAGGHFKNTSDVAALISQAHADVYVGQFLDLSYECDVAVSEEDYYAMISKTTGAFIRASLVAGAMLWDAPKDVVVTLGEAGRGLGMAYQLRDDVIDIIGDPECTGKQKTGDIKQRKMRLPVIHALRHAPEHADRLAELLRRKRPLEESEVQAVTCLLHASGSLDYAMAVTKEFCARAVRSTTRLRPELKTLVRHLRSIAQLISSFQDS